MWFEPLDLEVARPGWSSMLPSTTILAVGADPATHVDLADLHPNRASWPGSSVSTTPPDWLSCDRVNCPHLLSASHRVAFPASHVPLTIGSVSISSIDSLCARTKVYAIQVPPLRRLLL